MNYLLMTGATGLLGRYLVRDLLLAGVPLAVVVRGSRRTSAKDRVEAMIRYWEEQLKRELPRPIVLTGDLTEPLLGLSTDEQEWVISNVESVLHNAASLSFVSTGRESEPWRSNVDGTQNVIDLCKLANIREFHHVSTAYVAGLREGVCKENELNVGQQFGNPYEESKVMAEEMVRAPGLFDKLTVYRPGIIIGDSVNGFTTTFHGFYAALQLSYTLNRAMNAPDHTGMGYREQVRMTLDGTESKNLVPVDWVSEVMVHIMLQPKFHGDTYHLTPRHPVTTRLLREVLQASIGFYGTNMVGHNTVIENPTQVEELFYEHIHVYNSYWRNDPTFDTSNVTRVAPHIPCPHVDLELLMRLSQVAIDMGFQWKDKTTKSRESVSV
ncbi:SDR family oxidoreductase [Planctomycetaceae bacterium SH248]